MTDAQILDFLVIGAGPAGLSAALEARRGGLEKILVLEKGPSHSQMIRTYYKEAKRVDARYAGQDAICFGLLCLRDGNRETYLSFMDYVIEENKIDIRYGVEVWSVVKDPTTGNFLVKTSGGDLYCAKTVLVAIGKMGRPNQPDYWKEIPNALKNNKSILFDINSRPMEGLEILVVGGGDSACEYAQMLAIKNRVSISYRRARFERANDTNRKLTSELLSSGQVTGFLPSNIQSILDDGGRPRVQFAENAFPEKTFDAVIYGLGGMNPVEFLRSSGVALNPTGEPIVNDVRESSVEGLYVAGDLLGKGKGGGSIIAGFNSSAQAVREMLKKYHGRELEPAVVTLDHLRF